MVVLIAAIGKQWLISWSGEWKVRGQLGNLIWMRVLKRERGHTRK